MIYRYNVKISMDIEAGHITEASNILEDMSIKKGGKENETNKKGK